MKKILIAALSLIACSTVAFAAGAPGTGVLGSVHDMRTATGSGAGSDGTNDRVCAFCHTPHHAYQGSNPNDYYPLWARTLDVQNFTPYASSTINAIDWAADVAIGPTRLCMTCHDGTIAVDQHYGNTGSIKFLAENSPGLDGYWVGGAGIGSGAAGLTNDHPVGFNYDTVAIGPFASDPDPATVQTAGTQEDPWIRAAGNGELTYNGNKWGIKVADRLYTDPSDGSRYMTCATCHDVHNKKNMDLAGATANYLVLAPQQDSALCLTCHIK